MSLQTWQETLVSAQVPGPNIVTNAQTSILQPAQKITLPNNYFQVGKVLRLTATGAVTTAAGAQNGVWDFQLGGSTVFTSGNIALSATAKGPVNWFVEILMTCRTIGGAGVATCSFSGKFISEIISGSAAGLTLCAAFPAAGPTTGTAFDSTATLLVDLKWTQGVTAGSFTMHEYILESLN